MRKRREISKSQEVLLNIAQAGRDLFDVFASVRQYRFALEQGGVEYVRVLQRLQRERHNKKILYALKRYKYIETRRRGKTMYLLLTNKGMHEVIRAQCKKAVPCRNGEYILVLFDIPESERRARLQLRRFLKECGFVMLQQSVWQCSREVLPMLKTFVQSLNVEKWVTVLRGSQQ